MCQCPHIQKFPRGQNALIPPICILLLSLKIVSVLRVFVFFFLFCDNGVYIFSVFSHRGEI